MPVDPFSLDPPSSLVGRAASHVAWPLFSRLAGLDALRTTYARLRPGPDVLFPRRVLTALSIESTVDRTDLAHVPSRGPLIVAANHPTGALDGLVLIEMLRQVRFDVRLLANHMLARIPELRSICFFVDPFDGPKAAARSLAGLRAAHGWLRDGGALVMFPAGKVAHRRDDDGVLVDGDWSATLGRLASATGAAVVPAFVDAANSRAFYAAGRLHPVLRTLLLPRELLRSRDSRVTVRFGRALKAEAGETVRLARHAVEVMARPASGPAGEIARLGADRRLIEAGPFEVFCAPAREIPATLQEIGRLRAATFRAAGEGTGAEIDLDSFDRDYLHLFVWDRTHRRVVGAYRLAPADRTVWERGVTGLYTRTLFEYGPELIGALTPALELGRSFVRSEYQRDYQPLLLLWRGIGRFVVRHPHYRYLFGPVSISAAYSPASHASIVGFLEHHCLDRSLARLVSPRHPRPSDAPGTGVAATMADLDRRIEGLEPDGKRLPVLLRQYLKLNARALGFSVDPDFGHVTDALMVVDLQAVSPSLLRRYLGDHGLTVYTAARSAPGLWSAA